MTENNIIKSVGIDVSKKTLDICILKDKPQYLKILNNDDGHKILAQNLYGTQSPIVLESTGGYHINVSIYLKDQSYNVKVINPLISKAYHTKNIRRTKTDKIDSKLLAEIGIKEDLKPFLDTKENFASKKIVRLINQIEKIRAQLKTSLTGLKDIGFLTKETISPLEALIKNCTKAITDLRKVLISKSANLNTYLEKLKDLKGISDISLREILVEIGDITRFQNSKQLFAYCGLDPSIIESGTSIHSRGSITKRGSRILRKTLFQASWGLFMHNAEFRKYYDKKRGEGKHYYTCLIAMARKFLNILRTLIVKDESYKVNYRDC